MPILVNGEPVPEALIREQEVRIGRDPRWAQIAGERERAARLRLAAERAAVERVLVEQKALSDSSPIDAAVVEQLVHEHTARAGCRSAFNDSGLREWVERDLRIQRTMADMVAGAVKPTGDEVRAFYDAHRDRFRTPERFEASHIVRHVEQQDGEAQARQVIEEAFAELERGEPFAEVAERHSDCKGNGGKLAPFAAGDMVPEFEDQLRTLQAGARSGIFRTPFGYHIVHLHARYFDELAPFGDVRPDIERALTLMSEHREYQKCVGELLRRANVACVPDPN